MRDQRYAHSLPGRPVEEWETLPDHLRAVAKLAASLAAIFGWAEVARVAGLLHDVGKCSDEFFAYIKLSAMGGEKRRGPDHSTAGARAAKETYSRSLGTILAYIIAGHHAGLANWPDLERRLCLDYKIPDYVEWREFAGVPPPEATLRSTLPFRPNRNEGFSQAFLIRMLFSALVDADSLATEEVITKSEGRTVERGRHAELSTLRERLKQFMAEKEAYAAANNPSRLNTLRAQILTYCTEKASNAPGLFTMTVPTGGGKTLASLSFALDHAVEHGLRRVIYVIPYTSIVEQTADVFRNALKSQEDILEHHANFDWERGANQEHPDAEESEKLKNLRLASENWDVPIVVTTAVQFYESLFASRRSRCRKLHNLAKSVVVLDEAHMMPLILLLPSMAAVDELATNYGASVVLCTATQPALRVRDGFDGGFEMDDSRELAPDPKSLYGELNRFSIDWKRNPIADDEIVARFSEREQMLVIVNTRPHARALFSMINDMEGAYHLSTLMCPRHRKKVLAEIKQRLRENRPVRLVSTSLIEAGVDVDFPEVWRAAAGLDSILQAGGRCNREGGQMKGLLVVFEPARVKIQKDMEVFKEAAEEVWRSYSHNPNDIGPISAYFNKVYWRRGREALDAALLDGRPGILPALAENAAGMTFPFASISEAFVMIEDEKEAVIVPWRANDNDREADELLGRAVAMDRPRADDLRKLQQYTVGISPVVRDTWLAMGVLKPVHPSLGNALLKFSNLDRYDKKMGLDIKVPELIPTKLAQV